MRRDFPPTLWPVEVDETEFELALLNIAVNARDAMPNGGTFRVSARNVSFPFAAVNGLVGDFVALSLSDTGTGIAPDLLPRLFEPFFTTKTADKGSGLGLAQVHGFAHQAGGTVTVTSEVGRGTTITLYLRRSLAPATAVRSSAEPKAAGGHGLILMVEDNAEVASVTAAILETMGYAVTRATDAAEALAMLDAQRFDLMFSDIVMPGAMNGHQLAQSVRPRFPTLPILLTSGYSEIAEGAASEFVILKKPFDAASLQQAVRTAMESGRSE
jgi:two-component system NtrC family sensor kinase